MPARDPGEADLPAGLRAALALHGIPPGPHGYDVAALAAAIERLGWRYATEGRAPSQRGRHRYRALVFGLGTEGHPSHVSGRGRGAMEAEALAQALARLLGREA